MQTTCAKPAHDPSIKTRKAGRILQLLNEYLALFHSDAENTTHESGSQTSNPSLNPLSFRHISLDAARKRMYGPDEPKVPQNCEVTGRSTLRISAFVTVPELQALSLGLPSNGLQPKASHITLVI